MVETSVISVVSVDTVLVNKLSVNEVSSSALRDQRDHELLLLFLRQLSFDSQRCNSTAATSYELWIGIGTIIEVNTGFLVVRYLPTDWNVPVAGHSIHSPGRALAVLTSAHRAFRDSRGARIDSLSFSLLKAQRKLICPVAGCLFARDSKSAELCHACTHERKTDHPRLERADGLCLYCAKEPALPHNKRFCKRCLRAAVKDFIRDDNPDIRSLSDFGTEAIGRPASVLPHK